jgi:dTDP-4-dehydrorhamnose 3,5-epimerase
MYCARGSIWDVAVDVRLGSPTFGQWFGTELNDENHAEMYVPIGFAHGFCVLSDVADVLYKVSNPYDAQTESGIAWDDPDVGVRWPIDEPIVSERDVDGVRLAEYDWTSTVWQTGR